MSFLKNSHLLLTWMICVMVCQAGATVVTMKSGERLIGEVSPESDETTLILNSALLGEVKLPREQIQQQGPNTADLPGPEVAGPPSETPELIEAPAKPIQFSEAEMDEVEEETSFMDKLSNFKTPDSWKGNLRFGLDLGSGNSEWRQLYSKGNLVVDPKKNPNYYRFSGSYTYRTTERNGQTFKSTDRYDGNFTYRRDIVGSLFLQNSIAGRVDRIKGIKHEVQELVGLGFRIKPVEQLEVVLGGSGGVEDFNPGFEDSRSGLNTVGNVFQELTWRPIEKATFAQEFNYFMEPDEEYKYNYVFSASFRYRLTDLLGFEISFNKNYDSDVGNGNVREDTSWRNAIIVYF